MRKGLVGAMALALGIASFAGTAEGKKHKQHWNKPHIAVVQNADKCVISTTLKGWTKKKAAYVLNMALNDSGNPYAAKQKSGKTKSGKTTSATVSLSLDRSVWKYAQQRDSATINASVKGQLKYS